MLSKGHSVEIVYRNHPHRRIGWRNGIRPRQEAGEREGLRQSPLPLPDVAHDQSFDVLPLHGGDSDVQAVLDWRQGAGLDETNESVPEEGVSK